MTLARPWCCGRTQTRARRTGLLGGLVLSAVTYPASQPTASKICGEPTCSDVLKPSQAESSAHRESAPERAVATR